MGLAFGAGLVAALNPCGFAMLPAYLALVVRGQGVGRRAAVGRALIATAAMSAGFLTVFGGFGFLTVSAASTVQRLPSACHGSDRHRPCRPWYLAARRARDHGAWVGTRCAVGADGATGFDVHLRDERRGGVIVVHGRAVPRGHRCGISRWLGARPHGRVRRLCRRFHSRGRGARGGRSACQFGGRGPGAPIVPYVNRISGALLVVVGVYVGYYGLYEIRLFTGNGNPEDRVIAAAGRVQGAIAGWVHQHGAWPWLVALAALTIAAFAAAWRASASARYRRADRATAGDEP